jgi:hypothetical protein
MSIVIFWVVTPYRVVGGNKRFGATYSLRLPSPPPTGTQRRHIPSNFGAHPQETTQKTTMVKDRIYSFVYLTQFLRLHRWRKVERTWKEGYMTYFKVPYK